MDKPRTFNTGDLAALPAALGPLTEHKVDRLEMDAEDATVNGTSRRIELTIRARRAQHDPSTWSNYAAAVAAVNAGEADGIGYVLAPLNALAQRHRGARPRRLSRSRKRPSSPHGRKS